MDEQNKATRFRQVVIPHLDAACNLARWLVRRREDANDVVQEAMLRAFRSFEGCREATVRPWLLRIVRNAAYDRLNDEKNSAGFADINPDDPDGTQFVTDAFTGPYDDPESLLIRDDDHRSVDTLIAALPVGFREVVILRDLEELSYKEIAEVAGIPVGTVMSRLARGRDMLQKAWKNRDE